MRNDQTDRAFRRLLETSARPRASYRQFCLSQLAILHIAPGEKLCVQLHLVGKGAIAESLERVAALFCLTTLLYPQQLAVHPAHLPLLEAEETMIRIVAFPEPFTAIIERLCTDFAATAIPVVGSRELSITTVEARFVAPETEYVHYLVDQLREAYRDAGGGISHG